MTPKAITIEEATVKTATVEVKTLTISGKQVTLAVFRQIKEEDLFIPLADGSIGQFGEPWGTVNYHWPGCDPKGGKHLHVVWATDLELRRFTAHRYWRPMAERFGIQRPSLYQKEETALWMAQSAGWDRTYKWLESLDQLFIAV